MNEPATTTSLELLDEVRGGGGGERGSGELDDDAALTATNTEESLATPEDGDYVDSDPETDWRNTQILSADEAAEAKRFQQLEEEQEHLSNSLISLSSHFAQVQFRLKQIGEAQGEDKEKLLKDLQEFAFRGVADMKELEEMRKDLMFGDRKQEEQRRKQNDMIEKLRDQLEDLERFAYEQGYGEQPSTVIMQKQKAVIDKLHEKMQLNLQIDKMSSNDLQQQVDSAYKQLVNPMKEQEQLVVQLRTQIQDLERFVGYLQKESPTHSPTHDVPKSQSYTAPKRAKGSFFGILSNSNNAKFHKNVLKCTPKGNHYGDERAHLELAVDSCLKVLEKYTLLCIDHPEHRQGNGENEEHVNDEVFERSEEEIVSIFRKKFCPALRALLEHGMQTQSVAASAATFGCFPNRTHTAPGALKTSKPLTHIWDVIVYFYELKNGRDLNDAPVRKLSQSFRLDSVGGKSITSKQVLLTTIENIVASHTRLRRTPDAMWKAFVSAALNEKKLPAWLRIIFRTAPLVEACYYSWSYVARTGCEELYSLLEGFHKFPLELPVDLALRPFEQIKEAF